MSKRNRQILLVKRPIGLPELSDFQLVESSLLDINQGEVLIETIYLSVDPYMRWRMGGPEMHSEPFELNHVVTGGTVGKVIDSKNPTFPKGCIVTGQLGWADYNVSDGTGLRRVDPEIAPIETALGVMGMTGLTAYFGLLDIGKPKAKETVVVSGAAGAVGTVVGQIAKIKECRVVGIAGSEQKIQYLKEELGFDAVINYRRESVYESLKQVCPDGIDVYFDNVGGEVSDAVMYLINTHARIIVCGQISEYNNKTPSMGPRLQKHLIYNQALMQGFRIRQYSDRFDEGLAQLGDWVREGNLSYRHSIVNGLENAPKAFNGLFSGQNVGKQLVKVSAEWLGVDQH
ncbi:NADP-dependent oxidoreductase [Ammoniphilus sp. 3BR4]|uniref:NADP-dependent oxidoreductase n=1 Tax=Ammoniphilus sp. 3BR4 TaxID=3158265 RepID=UPI003466CE76